MEFVSIKKIAGAKSMAKLWKMVPQYNRTVKTAYARIIIGFARQQLIVQAAAPHLEPVT